MNDFPFTNRVTYSEKVLDVMKVGVSTQIDQRLLADSKFSIHETLDYAGKNLVVSMERSLLADKVLKDTQRVPFSQNVEVEVATTRWGLKWKCIPVRKIHKSKHRKYIWGTVTVQCDFFRTFPLAEHVYPKELGRFYKWQELKIADVEKQGQRDVEMDCG